MLEFFAQNGLAIVGIIIGAGSLAGAIYNIRKCFKLGKKIDTSNSTHEQEIQITKEAILEAFKSAKLPSEIKLSISNKIEEILGQVRDAIIEEFKKNESVRTVATLLVLKILKFSQASSKLTDDEKNQIEDLLKLITEDDATIEI